jgi:pyruvate dehydrogenase E2 component (dihydrolipoamide acetyltransferase)
MTEGKIVSWVKSEGDRLAKGESVVVVESDKADMDVETFYDGILAAIVVGDGEVAPVGAAIGILAETEEELEEAKAKASSSSPSPSPSPSSPSPSSSNGGASVSLNPPPPPAESAIAARIEHEIAAEDSAPRFSAQHPASEGGKRIVASPYAKKLAKDLKVDLADVVGSGPLGRIVASDVEAAAASSSKIANVGTKTASISSPPPPPPRAPAPSPAAAPAAVSGNVVPFSTMQNAVSRNMVESLAVPTFRVGYTITTDALDALYKKVSSALSFIPVLQLRREIDPSASS